jgi:hypothetical protein
MGDVAAKDGSQETLVNLSALVLSLVLTPLASGNLVRMVLIEENEQNRCCTDG